VKNDDFFIIEIIKNDDFFYNTNNILITVSMCRS